MEEIPKYPIISERLKRAAGLRNIYPFIGAGVSRLAGYPDWEELADKSIKYFLKAGRINFAEAEQLSKLPVRVRISIAAILEEQTGINIDFKEILKPSEDRKQVGDEIFTQISKLSEFSKCFITTNYDEELDKIPANKLHFTDDAVDEFDEIQGSTDPQQSTIGKEPKIIYLEEELTMSCLELNSIIHVHGSVKKRESMVFSTNDYLKRYKGHSVVNGKPVENSYLNLLDQIFNTKNRCALFVGYGLNELEILEYVIEKTLKKTSSEEKNIEEPNHYLLQGFYSHDLDLARQLEQYYLSFGVEMMPFLMDEDGRESLIGVMSYLNSELPHGTTLAINEMEEMEELLK